MNKQDDRFNVQSNPTPVTDTTPVVNPIPIVDPTPTPVPDNSEIGGVNVRLILALGLPVAYFALLIMLHIFWLAYNHPDLQPLCLIGDGIFSSATTTIVGHYIGSQTNTAGVQTGVRLSRN